MARRKSQLLAVDASASPIADESPSEVAVEVESGNAEPVVVGYSIRSAVPSFWRCGRKFTIETTEVSVEELKPGEAERLLAEPNLIVKSVYR